MASSASASASDDDRPGSVNVPLLDPSAVAAPQAHAEWAASMHAYYAAATGHPGYAWPPPPQHLIAAAGAYGAPVPFPVYHHHPAYYAAHASMAAAGAPHMAGEAAAAAAVEGKSKRKSSGSQSGEDNASGSCDGGSEESSDKRDADADQKVSSSAKRRKSSDEGEPSQAATAMKNAAAESALKLSVSAPPKSALPTDTPNLNIGIDIWSNSPSAAVRSEQGEENSRALSKPSSALSQLQDERELKRERRKQSNRESARRSRLRKQQECEELAQKVTDLTAINSVLRSELDQLKKECEEMEAENSQLMDKMVQSEGPSVLTTLSIQIDASKGNHGSNGQIKHRDNDKKG